MSPSRKGQTKFSFLVILYLNEHFHQKIIQHAIVIAGTTVYLLKEIFFLAYKVILYYFCCTAKTVI